MDVFRHLAPGVRVRREGFGLLFYRGKEAKLSFLKAPDLFDVASDGGNGMVLRAYNGNAEDRMKRERALQMLFRKGLLAQEDPCGELDDSGRIDAQVGVVVPASAGTARPTHEMVYSDLLTAPVNVTWEITSLCNLHCRHCLSAGIADRCPGDLTFDQCCRFIDELQRMHVFQINFGGGEPFLRADFPAVLDYAHRKGITTCVSTNGTVLNEDLAERLAAMDLLYIQVSLDGASPSTNDAIRGPGTFEMALSGIELLKRRGIPNVSTNTVVTAANVQEILPIYELGKRYGVKTRLSRFRPSGNGKAAWQQYHLSKGQLRELSEFLSAHREVLTGDSFFSITAKDRRELGLNMCGAAKMTCSVLPDGSVYPCAFLQDDPFLAGNITEESLQSIWRSSPQFTMLRDLRIKSCESCARFDLCHGGCPAVAYFLRKSLHHGDPECLMAFQESVFAKESYDVAGEYGRTV